MTYNIKKLYSASAIALAIYASSWGAHAADATSAVVNMTATVVGQTCTPSWASSDNVSVDLGRVSAKDLVSQGDVGSARPFSLSLTNCDSGVTKVSVTAAGTPDGTDASAFKNTGDATGVAVTLFGGDDGTQQLMPDGSSSVLYSITGGAAKMPFSAKLIRSAATDVDENKGVKNGSVISTATLYMTYQ